MSNDPWDGILDEGEKILWQGRPVATFANSLGSWVSLAVLCVVGWFFLPPFFEKIASGGFHSIVLMVFAGGFAFSLLHVLFGDLIRRLSVDNFALYCTPVVNLQEVR